MRKGTSKRGDGRRAVVESIESRLLMSYTPAGPDFLLNESTAGNQSGGGFGSSVAADAAGNFVAAFTGPDGSGNGVFARRFDPTGTPLGSEFRVNTTTYANQSSANVAMNPAGDFVIVWEDDYNDTYSSGGKRPATVTSRGVFGQRFDAQGAPLGGEFRVNTTSAGTQDMASVEMDDAGNVVVIWRSDSSDVDRRTTTSGIVGRRFDAAGGQWGGEFRINEVLPYTEIYPSMDMDGAGNFVAAWESRDGVTSQVRARRFAPGGAPVGGDVVVSSAPITSGEWTISAVGIGPDSFTAAWRRGATTQSVHAKRYAIAADGSVSAGPDFLLDGGRVGAQPSQIEYDAAGNSLIAWQVHNADGSSDSFAREYDGSGAAAGGAFRLNSSSGKCYSPSIAFQPNGNFLAVFNGTDASGGLDVFGRRFIRDVASTFEAGTPATTTGTFSDTPVETQQDDSAEDSAITEQVLI